MGKTDVFEIIAPGEAKVVLKELVASDPEIRKKAREIALKIIGEVDVDEVAEDVLWELDSIPVEEVWDNSGRTRNGYVDPGDCAWRLFEDALDPFMQRLRKCRQLRLTAQAKLCCMAILQGIHRFETESESEFKGWAADAPGEFFASVYEEWRKGNKNKKDLSEVNRFAQELCPKKAKCCR